MGALFLRFLALFRRNRLDRDLEDELAFHLAMREEDQLRQGMPPNEANRTARRLFGNRTLLKEQARGAWTFSWLESVSERETLTVQ
jgi:hypothetical protein